MNDPHVVALIYSIEHSDSVDYEMAEPFVREESEFCLEVKNKKVRFELKDHYPTESDARKSIEEYIRTWEFSACLERGADSFKLRFDKAEIEDRNPTPGGGILCTPLIAMPGEILPASLTLKLANYPSPPSGLTVSAEAQTIYDRYMNYRRGHESLLGMAYFCLTVLENSAGGRKAAARKYQIADKVLGKVGYLCSEKGGSEARKAGGVTKELTEEERHFLNQAIKKVIYRVAEKTCNPLAELDKISLSDLQNVKLG